MTASIELNLDILNEYMEEKCGGKEYFFGCWSPTEFNAELSGNHPNIQSEQGKNWIVLRNGADICEGLLFPKNIEDDIGPDMVIFRGYLAEEKLHTYSANNDVRNYWSGNLINRHNGIFNAVTISNGGSKLSFISDIFGIGPLFYRQVGDVVLFSSCCSALIADSGSSVIGG